jgi:hypothetical protein
MFFKIAISIGYFLVINTIIGANGQCLPLTLHSSLCAYPPGTVASDGYDDVCVLTSCCIGSKIQTVEIPNGQNIPCNNVNCTSVCQLSQNRATLGEEACDSTCTPQPRPQGLGSDCVGDCKDSIWAETTEGSAAGLCEFLVEAGDEAAAAARCEPKAAVACAPLEESAAIPEPAEGIVALLVALCQAAYLAECVAATKPNDLTRVKALCEALAEGTVEAACWLKCNGG